MDILLNSTRNNVPEYVLQLKKLVNWYFGNWVTLTIISENLAAWLQETYLQLYIIQNLKSNVTKVVSHFVILDLYNWDWNQQTIELLSWDAETNFIVVANEERVNFVVKSLFTLSVCKMLIVSPKQNGIQLYNQRGSDCNTPPVVEKFDKESENHLHYLKLAPCYYNRVLNISFMDFPPFVLLDEGSRLRGAEGFMIDVVIRQLGIVPKFVNRHEAGWGQFNPPEGLLGDIATGSSVLGVGALLGFEERWRGADLVYYTTTIKIVWAVPVGVGISHPTWFLILVSEFSITVWLSILGILGLLTIFSLISSYFRKETNSKGALPFHFLGLFIGIPQKLLQSKSITLSCIIGGFLTTAYYESIMSSRLTAPAEIPDLHTLEDVSKSKLNLYGPPGAFSLLKALSTVKNEPHINELIDRFKITTKSFSDMIPGIVNERNAGFLRHGLNMLYISQKTPNAKRKVHMVDDSVKQYKGVVMLKKKSCLTPFVNKIFQRLHDSGLTRKWYNDVRGTRRSNLGEGPRKLFLSDIDGVLILVALGWSISIATFTAEIALSKILRMKNSFRKISTPIAHQMDFKPYNPKLSTSVKPISFIHVEYKIT